MSQAWEFQEARILEHRDRAEKLKEEDVEGDQELLGILKHLLLELASMLEDVFKYMDQPPWCFARCDTEQGCKDFLQKVAAHPMAQHDPLTRKLVAECGDHLKERAEGGELHSVLSDWVRFMRTTPLDESAGEGYHRSTNKEKERASASSSTHLKRTVRRAGALAHVRSWRRKYGIRGVACIRHEWYTWKHILQGEGKHMLRPKRVSTKRVIATVYREDAMA